MHTGNSTTNVILSCKGITLFDEPGYEEASQAMSGTAAQHLWKYGSRQFVPYCHYYLTGPGGLLYCRITSLCIATAICPGFSPGKTPPADHIPFPLLSVSGRTSLITVCCSAKTDQDEEICFLIWIKIHNYSMTSLMINIVRDPVKTSCLPHRLLYAALVKSILKIGLIWSESDCNVQIHVLYGT